jgi:NADH:ubiquinone oxidoreductase subunit C
VSSSPSETDAQPANEAEAQSQPEAGPLEEYAEEVAGAVGGNAEVQFDTIKVKVPTESWVDAHLIARDQLGLVFFSWLSAIHWSNEVEVGDSLSEEVEERIELLTTVGDVSAGRKVTFSTDLQAESPVIPSLIEVYAGANWHEREAHEMFGIDFLGHPNLAPLYLPDGFIGNPLLKSYPLLTREVKPWPGKVDVEAMPEKPSTENPES